MSEQDDSERVLLEDRFRKEGGMKERMYRVRTGYRAEQDRRMQEMEATIKQQAARIKALEAELERMRREREDERTEEEAIGSNRKQ